MIASGSAPSITIRPARADDADRLAELVNCAEEGMLLYLSGKLASAGKSGEHTGQDEGSSLLGNASIIEVDGKAVGCLIGYEIPNRPEPMAEYMPIVFAPVQELANLAPSTWCVSVLAVLPDYRGNGLGSQLLRVAEENGRRCGKRGMSAIVSDTNIGARCVFERCGYRETARREMVKEGWTNPGREWILLTKPL